MGENQAAQPLFRIHDAEVVRGSRTILHVDDFELREGEHVALLGPNGAGKSTFIQLLTREVFPVWREDPPVLFRGAARPLLSDIRSTLGVVSSTMHEQVRVHLPALDIVVGGIFGTLGLPLREEVTEAHRAAAMDALDRLGIAGIAAQDIMTMSTGQARRVLVARELVRDPRVLIFDEPCTGLDPEGMYHVRDTMRTLASEGRSVILVTHYPEDIIPAIGRVLLIKDSRIFADGPKGELLRDDVLSDLFDVPLAVSEDGGWYKIQSGPVTGYVKAEYILTGDAAKQEAMEVAELMAIVSTDRLNARTEPSTDAPIWTQISNNERYDVISQQDGWVEIALDTTSAYVATDFVDVRYALPEAIPFTPLKEKESLRTQIVNYALQFVGNRYVWGGNDPHSGVDCSGFTKYVYSHVAGVSLPRVSREQARTGTKIDSSKMRPGDLIVYTNRKGTVNHVAMYIGNGQIVHAASRRSGIKISTWNYRNPYRIVNMLGD